MTGDIKSRDDARNGASVGSKVIRLKNERRDILSLKIPRKKIRLENYFFSVSKNQEDSVYVVIKYYPNDNPSIEEPLYKQYEIRPDIRWNKRADLIIEKINEVLNAGLNGVPIKIREDKVRMYLWFDNEQLNEFYQFTGISL